MVHSSMKQFVLFCFVLNLLYTQVAFFPSDRSFFNNRLKYNEVFGSTKHLLDDVRPFQLSYLKKQFNTQNIHRYLNSENWQSSKEFDVLPRSLFPQSTDSLSRFINWRSNENSFYTEINIFGESINKDGNALSGAYEYRLIGQVNKQLYYSFLNREIAYLSNKNLSLKYSQFLSNNHFENFN